MLAVLEHAIREMTRSPRYWAVGDRLAMEWFGTPLSVPPEVCRAAAVNLPVALDTLYEDAAAQAGASFAELHHLTLQLQACADPERGRATESAGETAPPALIGVTERLIAVLAAKGWTTVADKTKPERGELWLDLWRKCLHAHDAQQERTSAITLVARMGEAAIAAEMAQVELDRADLHPEGTFADGVREYLARSAETGASALALVGCLPFAGTLSPEVLADLLALLRESDLLASVSRLLRFAQDVRFNPAEAINSGIAGLAAERRLSVCDAEVWRASAAEIGEKLRHEWSRFYPAVRQELEAQVARAQRRPCHDVLHGLVQRSAQVALSLAGA